MNTFSSHVAFTIKSAIKQKLVELGTYVDDELPDYIMVLVVNRKTKEQMDNDLSLFLGHNTEHFTSWLTGVLEQLNNAATSKTTAPAVTAPAAPPPAVSEKPSAPMKEEQKEIVKEESKKVEAKISDVPKEKKKSKEKKHEKREKKKKKKEKKDLEKKLKKEAKKKAAAEALEKLNRDTLTAISKETEVKPSKSDSSKKSTELKTLDHSSKRKRSSSGDSKSDTNNKEASPPPSNKRTVIEAKGKNKTLTITKTIHNDHVKPLDDSDSDENTKDKEPDSSQTKPLTKKKKIENFTITTTNDVVKPNPVVVEKKKPESSKRADKKKSEEARPVNNDAVDIVDMKVDVNDELHEEIIEEIEEEEEEEIEEEEIVEEIEEKIVEPTEQKRPAVSSTAKVSIMDRLGPRSKVSPEDDDDGMEDGKKRVINLLEESSFPPKKPERKSAIPSKVSVSAAPSKKLEARVRPLSVIERSDRDSNSTSSADRPHTLSSVVSRSNDDVNDEDASELTSSVPMLSSKVEVTGTRRSGPNRAANTALILRAVADAHKSVTTTATKRLHVQEEPQPSRHTKKPKMELFSKGYRNREEGRLKDSNKLQKLSITVPNDASDVDRYNQPRVTSSTGLSKRLRDRMSAGGPQYVVEEEEMVEGDLMDEQPVPYTKARVINPMDEVEEYIEEVEEWEEDVESLSGVRGDSLMTDVSSAGVGGGGITITTEPDPIMLSLDELIQQKDSKYATRCVYWPACRSGDKCPYKHPTQPCKMFPSCSFGDKCLYIHPNCKFDAQCTRSNCPYTHASPRNLSAAATAAPIVPVIPKVTLPPPGKTKLVNNLTSIARPTTAAPGITTPVIPKPCYYGAGCTNYSCPFTHPKACRFGNACHAFGCMFYHPPDRSTNSVYKLTKTPVAQAAKSVAAKVATTVATAAVTADKTASVATSATEPNVIVSSSSKSINNATTTTNSSASINEISSAQVNEATEANLPSSNGASEGVVA